MAQSKVLKDLITEFFSVGYKKDLDEYHIKMKQEHLTSLIVQIETIMMNQFISHERFRELSGPTINLNDQLIAALRDAKELIKFNYMEWLKEVGLEFKKRQQEWTGYIQETPELKKILDLLDALDLHDVQLVKQKDQILKYTEGGKNAKAKNNDN